MWRHLAIGFLVYLCLAVQPNLVGVLGPCWFRPWVPGMGLIVCATIASGPVVLIWGAILGLGVDCLSGVRLGIHVVSATVATGCFQSLRGQTKASGLFSMSLAAFAAIFIWKSMASALAELSEHRASDFSRDFSTIVQDSSSTTVSLVIVVLVYRFLMNEIPHDRRSSLSNRWSMLTD